MWINIKKKGEKSMNLNANSTFPKTQKKLVIAEKPSVAQSIAKVIGADKREDGYLEGKRLCLKMENLSETQRSK